MPVKLEKLKTIRLKPETYQALDSAKSVYPFRVPIWELANAAIMAGLKSLERELTDKPQRKTS